MKYKFQGIGSPQCLTAMFFKMFSIFVLLSVCCLAYSLGSNNVYHLNERDFEGHIRDKDIMLVDFFAPWCHHCQELSPELDAAADQLATKNQYVFAKVDCVNDGKDLCQRFNIQGYPTIKLFKYGQYVGDYVGQRDRGSLMQYVDSVASTVNQHAPLTSGAANPATLAQAINYKPQAAVFPSHLASSIHAHAPAIAPTYMNQANTQAKNPSLMASFYGSSAHAHYPPHAAAYLGNAPPVQQSSPDSLQSKFGNLASLSIYRAKLKMIAAYKNYQRRLKEYRQKLLTATKTNVKPGPQSFAGAVTQPPRPGVNAFAQPQTYRGYYRPEAMAAQNVQINRAYPQVGYGAYTTKYASPYGYQALASSPYYRSKMGPAGKRQHGKNRRPAPRPARVRKPAYNRQPGITQVNNQAARYYKQQQLRMQQQQRLQQQFHQQPQQQYDQKPAPARQQQPQQQFHQERQQPQQQYHQEPAPARQQQPQQQFHQERQQPQQQYHQEPAPARQQQQQQQFHQGRQQPQQQLYKEPAPVNQQEQASRKPQAPQPEAPPTLVSPSEANDDPLKATDSSALKDLKADIESAIQDALKNAVIKQSHKTNPSATVHVDGARANPQANAAHSDLSGSGSGVQSQTPQSNGKDIEDAITGEGSGSGVKPDSP